MIKKKIIILLIFLFASGCGYKAIYSSKNTDFSIGTVEKENNQLNNEFERIIKSLTNNNNKKILNLKIESDKNIEIKSKNKKGNPLKYELIISTKIKILNSLENTEKIFVEKINYNNEEDKFSLSKYEQELEKLLIQKLVGQIIEFLTTAS